MIARVKDKTQDLQLAWNTKIEFASRILIIFVTIAILLMSFFVGAGFAKIYDQFHDIIGDFPHSELKKHYIKVGSIVLAIMLPISILVAIPYVFMKNPATIKIFIIISFVVITAYSVGTVSVMVHYERIYEFTNPYIKSSYWVIGIGYVIIVISKVFLWREIKKQFKMRKNFEYLNEEREFKKISERQKNIIDDRDRLLKDGIELEDVDQYIIDNANETAGNTIKKKHFSRIWKRRAKIKETDNK